MKKVGLNNALAVVLGISILLVWFLVSWNESRYTRTGTVKRVEPFSYELTDKTGNSFWFYSNDIIKDGTTVKATLDNKGTVSYIYDDEIIKYKIISNSQD